MSRRSKKAVQDSDLIWIANHVIESLINNYKDKPEHIFTIIEKHYMNIWNEPEILRLCAHDNSLEDIIEDIHEKILKELY